MSQELFGDVIYSYSRAQAIEDGVLVDLRFGASAHAAAFDHGDLAEVVANAGIRYPIACTRTVFEECIELTPAAKRAHNDVKGRLWDVLWMLKCAIRTAKSTDRIAFSVLVVRKSVRPTLTKLVAVCGPGDTAEPVITIMFPDED